MKMVLGLDLGVGSIGWALIEVDDQGVPVRIIAMGSRIVPLSSDDTKEFTSGNAISKNQDRTAQRTQRKGYDRYILRRVNLTNQLRDLGMLPDERLVKLPILDLWQLRADAATKKLSLPELGRVLYHLNQKRGYKHSKSDDNTDKKQKDYVASINQRYALIQSLNKTIGQYFVDKLKENEVENENGRKFYTYRIKDQVLPRRAYEAEFDQIMSCQRQFYPNILTDEIIDNIRNKIIYYQRHLKSCKHLVSLCEFEKHAYQTEDGKTVYDGPKVAPKSSPLFQLCKIWEEVNNLTLKNRKGDELYISKEQRLALFNFLDNHEKLNLTDMYSILGINKSDGWWGGKAIGKGLKGNSTKMLLEKALVNIENKEDLMKFDMNKYIIDSKFVDETTGEIIKIISPKFQQEPLYRLWHTVYSINDKNELSKALKKDFGIEDDSIVQNLYSIDFNKSGFGNKSTKFMRKILPYLQDGLMYSEACEYIGVLHSNSITKAENEARELLTQLPPIQKNELRQPIVEKILNQMINVVNSIVNEYGQISEIRIELARELKQSKEERFETDKNISKRERDNDSIAKKIEELGIRSTRRNIQKYRLWEETHHECMYCGQIVNAKEFLTGSEVEIEHIIPKALLFDDSFANKVCSCRKCNSAKGDRTAYDFMNSKPENEFQAYIGRVEDYYQKGCISKTKRDHLLASYKEYTIRKLKGNETESDKKLWENFIDRQLRQSQYIARKSQEILKQICRNVFATSGSVTDFVRHVWGYDEILHNINLSRYRLAGLTEICTFEKGGQIHKEERIKDWTKRLDNRHHAIDALVIACTKQGFIQRINTLNTQRDAMFAEVDKQNVEWKQKHSLLEKWMILQPHFSTAEVTQKVNQILISLKAGKRIATFGKRVIYSNGKRKVVQENVLIPRGALHEQGLYGQIQQYNADGTLHSIIVKKYKLGIGAQGFLFTGKETYKRVDKLNKKTGKTEIKIEDKIDNVLQSIIDGRIRNLILERLNRGFKDGNDYKSDVKKALDNLRDLDADPIYADASKKVPIKTIRCCKGLTAVVPVKRDSTGKAISFVKPGNNHHIAIYKDSLGGMHEHVVTFWHAVERKKYGIPVIIKDPIKVWDDIQTRKDDFPESFLKQLPDVNWTYEMSMQQNEMFILGMSDDAINDAVHNTDYTTLGENLYKVQNLSESTYRFCLNFVSQYNLKMANKQDKRFYNIQSLQALFNLNPHKVVITLLGEIRNE